MVEFPGIPKPCCKQLIHVYLALFYDKRVKPAINIQLAIDHNQPLPSGKVQWDDIIMQQQITKEKWLAKTIEIQQIIKERQMMDYENVVKVWEGRNMDLKSLEKQQVACDNLNPWLEKVLLMMQECTGKSLMIIVSGPELKSQGDMVVTCMHQGVMPGSHPIDFNTFATSLFTDTVIPKTLNPNMPSAQNEREEKYGLLSNTAPPMDVADTKNDVNLDEDDEVSHVNIEDVHPDGPLKTPDISSTIGLNEDLREDTLADDATVNQNQQEDSIPDDAMGLNPSQLEGVPIDNSITSSQNPAICSNQTLQEDIPADGAVNSRGHKSEHDIRAKSGLQPMN
ncbi:hypothetical protein BS47DRAFT_1369062 [Hydnum rufescens UP504]|uniref:Uncharacterized protein n=1 Tax=Hydnum rufescens UP504 TaxID=1448309 RepID=A0A9P6AF67_9AGAM|nr:hypothetical protein BS47DRAFT_1369062 [Hydnum rufescens UP504]